MAGTIRIIICFTLVMVCLYVVGCSNQGKEVSFIATVLENNQASLLVEPVEGSIELRSSDRFEVHVGDAVVIDQQANKVGISNVAVGYQVLIVYSGEIAESYPAQIRSSRIQIVE